MKHYLTILLVLSASINSFAFSIFGSGGDSVKVIKDGGRGQLIINQDVIFDKYDSKRDSYDTHNLIGESDLIRFEISPMSTSGIVAFFRPKTSPDMIFSVSFIDKNTKGMVAVPYLNKNIDKLQITVDKCKTLRNSFQIKSIADNRHIGICFVDIQMFKM